MCVCVCVCVCLQFVSNTSLNLDLERYITHNFACDVRVISLQPRRQTEVEGRMTLVGEPMQLGPYYDQYSHPPTYTLPGLLKAQLKPNQRCALRQAARVQLHGFCMGCECGCNQRHACPYTQQSEGLPRHMCVHVCVCMCVCVCVCSLTLLHIDCGYDCRLWEVLNQLQLTVSVLQGHALQHCAATSPLQQNPCLHAKPMLALGFTKFGGPVLMVLRLGPQDQWRRVALHDSCVFRVLSVCA